jgi:hypothetical protein
MSPKGKGPTPGPFEAMEGLPEWITTVGSPYGHGPMHVADLTIRGWGHLTGTGACRLSPEEASAIMDANRRMFIAAPILLAKVRNDQRLLLEAAKWYEKRGSQAMALIFAEAAAESAQLLKGVDE